MGESTIGRSKALRQDREVRRFIGDTQARERNTRCRFDSCLARLADCVNGKDHMNISVSRQELDETAKLLELLREWETLTRISDYYSRGEVVFKIDGNHGKLTHGRSVDGYGIVNHPSSTCVQKCHRDIDALVAGMAKEAAIKAVEIIKSHMPIPVE